MTARSYAGLVYARALEYGATPEEAERAARAAFTKKRYAA